MSGDAFLHKRTRSYRSNNKAGSIYILDSLLAALDCEASLYIDLKWRIVRLRLSSVSLAHRNAKRRYSTRLGRARASALALASGRASSRLARLTPARRNPRFPRAFPRISPSVCRSVTATYYVACAVSAYFECPVREYQKLLIHSMPLRVCAACTRAQVVIVCARKSGILNPVPIDLSVADQVFFYRPLDNGSFIIS